MSVKRITILSLVMLSSPALAQRADENAITQAEDAFGTSIGNEDVGIYNSFDVRGFSPTRAGTSGSRDFIMIRYGP
jgi:iron complex outermembrane receptor protein